MSSSSSSDELAKGLQVLPDELRHGTLALAAEVPSEVWDDYVSRLLDAWNRRAMLDREELVAILDREGTCRFCSDRVADRILALEGTAGKKQRPVEVIKPTYPIWETVCPNCGVTINRRSHASDLDGMLAAHGIDPPETTMLPRTLECRTMGRPTQPSEWTRQWRCPGCGTRWSKLNWSEIK